MHTHLATDAPVCTIMPVCILASLYPSCDHQICLWTSVSCVHSHWEPHVGSEIFWEAGQVNRCWETPLRSAGSPGSQNDPPTPHSSSRPSQQGHTVRPPRVLVSLDADRAHRGVWRILTRPQELHRCPRGPFPVLSAVLHVLSHLLGSCTSLPLPTLPGP